MKNPRSVKKRVEVQLDFFPDLRHASMVALARLQMGASVSAPAAGPQRCEDRQPGRESGQRLGNPALNPDSFAEISHHGKSGGFSA